MLFLNSFRAGQGSNTRSATNKKQNNNSSRKHKIKELFFSTSYWVPLSYLGFVGIKGAAAAGVSFSPAARHPPPPARLVLLGTATCTAAQCPCGKSRGQLVANP